MIASPTKFFPWQLQKAFFCMSRHAQRELTESWDVLRKIKMKRFEKWNSRFLQLQVQCLIYQTDGAQFRIFQGRSQKTEKYDGAMSMKKSRMRQCPWLNSLLSYSGC